jgi:O-glycosyl hydrolase
MAKAMRLLLKNIWSKKRSAKKGLTEKRRRWFEELESRTLLSAATVNFNDVLQVVDGFGTESTWGDNPAPSSSVLQLMYSQTDGIGLTILRGSLCANGYNHQVAWDQRAAAYGVKLIVSPRGPAVAWLTDFGNDTNGYLDPAHYQDYANMVADFLENSAAQGIPIYAVSMDVESDMTTEITAKWNGDTFAALLPYFGATFRSRGITTKIMGTEDVGWTFLNLSQILGDPSLSQYLDIIADHGYGQLYSPYGTVTNAQGRHIWMTENIVSTDGNTEIQNAVDLADDIHRAFTVSGVSAYVYYWSTFLMDNWTPLKDFWALGNYSKFVRPGWVMVGETDDGGLDITTFKDPVSGKFAIVVNNSGTTDVSETFTLNGLTAASVIPYVTSATDNLAAYSSISVTSGTFSAVISAQSIVTYYGVSSDAATLQTPVNLSASPNYGALTTQMALSWTDNSSSETGYTVERSTNGVTWTVLTSSLAANTTTYVNTGLAEATTYYYRVKATSGGTSSDYSSVATGSTILAAPSSVSSSSITGGKRLTWTRNSGVNTGVTIQRSTDGLTWTTIASLSGSTTSYNDTIPNYNSNQIYWYRVRNTTSSRTSAYAQYNTTVNTPTGFTATLLSPTSVKLTWTNNAVGAYAAYIKRNGSVISPANLSINAGTYTVTGLTENTAYTFNIQALGPDAWYRPSLGVSYGAWSGTATTSVTTPVAPPTGLSAVSSTAGAAVLTWLDNSSIETAYQVEISTDGSTWTVLTSTLAAGTTTYTDTAAPTSGSVYYRVKAVASSASSAYLRTQMTSALPTITSSATVTGTTTTLAAAAPTGFGTGTLTYTWSLNGTPPASVTYSANGTTAAATTTATFSAAGSYAFRITISDSSGNTTSNTKTVTVSQTVTSITVLDNSAKASYGGPQEPTPSIAKSTWEQLSATAYDQFGTALSTQPTFTWTVVSGGGSVSSSGLYSAPANAATPIVRATSGSVSGQITLNVVATPQLVASYGFNETSGYSFYNNGQGSSDNVAKLSGLDPTLTTGHVGGAIYFDGVDDSVWIGRDSDVDIRGQITMSVWIKPTSTSGTQTIISRGYGTWPYYGGTFLRIANGQYQVGYYDGSYRVAAYTIPTGDVGTWVHLVGTYDGKNWNLYRNATLVATYTSSRGTTYVDRAWRAGSNDYHQSPTDYFNGAIDSVRLYSTALSAGDVVGLYSLTPYLATSAAATPSTTTNYTATLSASAVDPDSNSDSGMIYTWSVVSKPTGAADPIFSVNGASSARSTIATFTTTGLYQLLVTITDSGSSGWHTTSSTYVIVQGAGSATPTVATPAAAGASTVTGTATSVSVLGADDGGESNLTYFWTSSGPASVTFPNNGTNNAKNTYAIFSAAGTYTLTAQIIDANGQYAASSATVTVVSTLTTISVSPGTAIVDPSATQQFTASGLDQFGNAIAATVTWSITSGTGSINSSGLFTAPSSHGGLVAVQAASGSLTGAAVVSVPIDNLDTGAVTYVGTWPTGTTVSGYFGTNYQYYNTTGGSGSATFYTTVPLTGQYNVYARWTSSSGRADTVYFDVISASGTTTITINEQSGGGSWYLMGSYTFNAGATASLRIRTPSDVTPSHSVVADAVRFDLVQSAPTVAKAASVSSNPVTSTSTVLSVLGADATGGESGLTYTWSTTGTPPAAVTLNANGTNAAKTAVVTFSKAGTYNLLCTITDSGGLSTTSSVSVTVAQTPVNITIAPSSGSQLTVTGTDQFNNALPSSSAFAWPAAGLTLQLAADGYLHLYQTGTTTDVVSPYAKAGLNSVAVTGLNDAAEALTVDLSAGQAIPAGGITFDGGTGAENSLVIIGAPGGNSVVMSASQITVNALAPVYYSNVTYFGFNLSDSGNSLAVNGATLTINQDNAISAGTSVTIDGGVLDLGGKTDTIGSLLLKSGSVANGTLYADSYVIESGTVTANIVGPGSVQKTTSAQATAGAISAPSVTVANGQLTASSVNSGTLTLGAGATLTIAAIPGGPSADGDLTPLASDAVQLVTTESDSQPSALAEAAEQTALAETAEPSALAEAAVQTALAETAEQSPSTAEQSSAIIESAVVAESPAAEQSEPAEVAEQASTVVENASEDAAVAETDVRYGVPALPNFGVFTQSPSPPAPLPQADEGRNIFTTALPQVGEGSRILTTAKESFAISKAVDAAINKRLVHAAALQTIVQNPNRIDAEIDFHAIRHNQIGKYAKQLEQAVDECLAAEEESIRVI